MNREIRALEQRRAQYQDRLDELLDIADRPLTALEEKDRQDLSLRLKMLSEDLQAAHRRERAESGEDVVGTFHGDAEAIAGDPKHGFRSAGEFFAAVKREGSNLANPADDRLRIGAATPTTVGNEISGADGGFLVPPEFSREIFTHAFGEDSLLPMTDTIDLTVGNAMVFPKDETVPWGTDGVRAYWQAEATAGTQTKPKISTTSLRLYKLMSLVPVTDELMEDTNALDAYLPRKIGDSIRWKINESILFGTGVGQPLGAFTGNAAITVAKESGQATLTLQVMNLAKMMARLPPGSFPRSQWFINNDVIPALYTLLLGNYPVFVPPGTSVGGVQTTSPYGMIAGRPINVSQHAKTFSSAGDVLLIDPFYVRSITKDMLETAVSLHLYFDSDAAAFRTTSRVDAQPKIVNPIAPFNGSNNLSPFVQLGAR